MSNVTKLIDSFSQLTLDLRKRLDEEGIPWIDNSGVIDRGWNKLIFERTWIGEHADINKYDLSVAYIYNPDLDTGYSYGYPDKLECNNFYDDEDPKPMSIDKIIELYKELQERNYDEHRL
nr:MAG TPA: hypothetical protein [Caudoviricetes sp.]